MSNATPAVKTERLAAQCRANAGLPAPGLERRHLLGNLANGGQNESPRELGRGIGRCAGVHVRRYDDAKTRAGFDVDMRPDASLADQQQPRQALKQWGADFGALTYEHERLRVLEALGERIGSLNVIVPDRDLVSGELREACQRAQRVMVVVEDRHLHLQPLRSTPRSHHLGPRRLATSAACRWRPVSSNSNMYS